MDQGASTASYYDVLGVAPDSSHEDIKRAFTERALKYHPDRQPDDETREHAIWRMREINEAWETLRNPAARAAYDAKLHDQVEAAKPEMAIVGYGYEYTGRSLPGGSAWFADEPEVADIEPIDEAEEAPTKSRFQLWHIGPLVIGGVVLVVVLLLLLRTNNLDDRPTNVQTRERFGPGACVMVTANANGDNQVTEVPCNGPNNGKVIAKVDFPHPCPLQTYNVVLAAEQVSLCLQR